MLTSLQGRLSVLFTAFVLLVLVSVGAMIWGLETQRQDALVINLAGRQRMLVQHMARLAFEAGEGEAVTNAALREVEETFDQTLYALLNGGAAPYPSDVDVKLPITRDPQIRSALKKVNLTWDEYRVLLDELQRTPREDRSFVVILQAIEQKSSAVLAQADEVVRLYEAASTAKINHLRTIQISFFTGALILLGVGAMVTRKSALEPLRELGLAANCLGENDLDSPVQIEGPQEIRALGEAFENMRVKLSSSRAELVELADSLEKRVTQRTAELDALNEVSREISSRLDMQQVLDSITTKARSLLGAEVASLCLLDESGGFLKMHALSGPREAVAANRVPSASPWPMQVLSSTGAVLCDIEHCGGVCKMLAEPYRTSHLASSLRVGDKVIGALCVGERRSNQYALEASDLLSKLANTAAVALQNAQLYAQAERVAMLEERQRVAAEMHDGLGQTLGYLGLMTDQTIALLSEKQEDAAREHLHKTREMIQKATVEVRHAITSLMEDTAPEIDLCARLKKSVDEFTAENRLSMTWHAEIEPRCSPQVAEQVLNVTLEALKNVAHHANAKNVIVQMGKTDGHYFVAIEDDGNGFDVSQPGPNGHFGLKIMEARAKHIGGQMKIESAQGGGTRVTLRWAMEKPA